MCTRFHPCHSQHVGKETTNKKLSRFLYEIEIRYTQVSRCRILTRTHGRLLCRRLRRHRAVATNVYISNLSTLIFTTRSQHVAHKIANICWGCAVSCWRGGKALRYARVGVRTETDGEACRCRCKRCLIHGGLI